MTYDPTLYSLTHTGNPGDKAYYLRMCPPGKSVLELGCGYGRITLALIENGTSVTGIENHDGMIQELTESAERLPRADRDKLRLLTGDMRHFELEERFDRIIIPYNGLLCLLSDRDVVHCLTTAARHLKQDGEILFDIYDVPVFDTPQEDDDEFELIASLYNDEKTIDIFERTLPHTDPRRLDTAYRYDIYDHDGNKQQAVHTIEQRCIYADHLPTLLAEAGLQIVSITGDFKDEPLNEDTGQVVVRARAATAAPPTRFRHRE